MPASCLRLGGHLSQQLCRNTPQLSAVTRLRFFLSWHELEATLPELLDVLLPQAPLLAHLDLLGYGLSRDLPTSLINLQGLKLLDLRVNVTDLPSGSYLTGDGGETGAPAN